MIFHANTPSGFCESMICDHVETEVYCMRNVPVDVQGLIVDAYLNGKETTKGIAKRFGVSDTSIRNVLRGNGVVPYKGPRRIAVEQEDRMIELYQSGLNAGQTADECGVVKSTVLKVLHRRDVELRPNIKRKILSVEKRKELSELYAGGETFKSLEERYGVSCSVVSSCLDETLQCRTHSWSYRGRLRSRPTAVCYISKR